MRQQAVQRVLNVTKFRISDTVHSVSFCFFQTSNQKDCAFIQNTKYERFKKVIRIFLEDVYKQCDLMKLTKLISMI